MDTGDALVGTAGRFPFVMVLTSTFLDGSFFLVFNAPLIISYLGGASFSGINELLTLGAVPVWAGIIKLLDGIALVTLFLLLSILAGIFLAPFSRGVAYAGTKLVSTLFKLVIKKILLKNIHSIFKCRFPITKKCRSSFLVFRAVGQEASLGMGIVRLLRLLGGIS